MRRIPAAALVVATALTLGSAIAAAPAAARPPGPASLVSSTAYRNPVSAPFADTFADPALIRAKDGWWYAYGTSDPLRAGEGTPLNRSRAGGTPVLMQNGNAWIGAGHNAVATDLAGQDWIVYHALDRADPYLDGTEGINERPMLLDRLDWVGGWPYVRAGRGPSDSRQPGPATGGRWVTSFDSGVPRRWSTTGQWAAGDDAQSGGLVRSGEAGSLLSGPIPGGVRVEADLRSAGAAYGLEAQAEGDTVRALLEPARGRLVLQRFRSGRVIDASAARLPTGFRAGAWQAVSLQVSAGQAVATVSPARLGDPVAVATLAVPGARTARAAGALATAAGVGVDNLSALPASRPVTRLVRERVPDRLVPGASDDFDGPGLGAGWSWVREDPAATVAGGALRWPTQAADLTGAGNDAAVLVRTPAAGVPLDRPWTVETKVSIDLGTDDIRNFSQAGLIAYVGDDLFARFSHVAIWNTRQTEFGKEMPYAGRLSYGGTIVGPPAATTWLRLTQRIDPDNGERELRAWSSRDGQTWVQGGVWTLPAGSNLRVGLVSHGGAGATARFDYFRWYR